MGQWHRTWKLPTRVVTMSMPFLFYYHSLFVPRVSPSLLLFISRSSHSPPLILSSRTEPRHHLSRAIHIPPSMMLSNSLLTALAMAALAVASPHLKDSVSPDRVSAGRDVAGFQQVLVEKAREVELRKREAGLDPSPLSSVGSPPFHVLPPRRCGPTHPTGTRKG